MIVLWVTTLIAVALGALAIGAAVYGFLRPETVLSSAKAKKKNTHNFKSIDSISNIAILIACFRGEATIASTVKAAIATGCDVYVVDDGSKLKKVNDKADRPIDQTTEVARRAGAIVVELLHNVGKPAALLEAYQELQLSQRYQAVAILDDDVQIEPDFIYQANKLMTKEVAIVVGKNITWWPDSLKWNIWIASRAYSYWSYQIVIRKIQSFFNVMNCISGSNSLYRTELLDVVLFTKPPYIVDDTFWVLETHRRQLGNIIYAPKAKAYLQDPTNFKDWYNQNLRWLWGTFQGIIGHRVGKSLTRFDFAYVVMMIQWAIYVISGPVALYVIFYLSLRNPYVLLSFVGGYGIWVVVCAVALRKLRLIFFIPVIIVADLIYRFIFVHALIKAIRQPTVKDCKWDSPARINNLVGEMIK